MVNFWSLPIGMVFKMTWCLGFDESVSGSMADRQKEMKNDQCVLGGWSSKEKCDLAGLLSMESTC